MRYRITAVATKDGKGHYCLVDVASAAGTWRSVHTTRTYRTHPAGVRANDEALSRIKRHAKEQGQRIQDITYA